MFMAKKEEEEGKLTVKLTLFKENLQPKRQKPRQVTAAAGAASQSESAAAAAAAGNPNSEEAAPTREPTISIVPVQYSANVPHRSQLLNKESSVTSTKILLRRHAHVPKRNQNAHEFFKSIYQAKMKDILYFLHIVSIRSVDPEDGKTPLMAALHIGNERQRREVFRYLAGHGATFSGRDSLLRRDLIGWASFLGRHEQLRQILNEMNDEPDLKRRDRGGCNCLHLAVMSGNAATVEIILEAFNSLGVGVEMEEANGLTAYLLARKLGHTRIAQLLVDKGGAQAHKRDPLNFRSPREWSAIGREERRLERERVMRAGNWGVMPLMFEEEADAGEQSPTKSLERGETQIELLMRSLAPKSCERSSQQLVHSALELWSEQHLPSFRRGARLQPVDEEEGDEFEGGRLKNGVRKSRRTPASRQQQQQRQQRRMKAAK